MSGLRRNDEGRRGLALAVETERVARVAEALAGVGLDAMEVESGEAAFALLAKGNVAPDLILLDVTMPAMSGLELCRQLRHHARTTNVPILFLSSQPGEGEKALEVGANEVLNRPFSSEQLQSSIRRVIAQRDLVIEAIEESLGGLMNERSARARAEGVVGRSVLLRVPLVGLQRRVKEWLDGLRGEDWDGDEESWPADGDGEVPAITVDAPSVVDLGRLLPELGVRVTGGDLEVDVEVPVSRAAHAR